MTGGLNEAELDPTSSLLPGRRCPEGADEGARLRHRPGLKAWPMPGPVTLIRPYSATYSRGEEGGDPSAGLWTTRPAGGRIARSS